MNGYDGTSARQDYGHIGGIARHVPKVGGITALVVPQKAKVSEGDTHIWQLHRSRLLGRRPGRQDPREYRFDAEKPGVFPAEDEGDLHEYTFTSFNLARSVRADLPNQRGSMRYNIQMKNAVFMNEFKI